MYIISLLTAHKKNNVITIQNIIACLLTSGPQKPPQSLSALSPAMWSPLASCTSTSDTSSRPMVSVQREGALYLFMNTLVIFTKLKDI